MAQSLYTEEERSDSRLSRQATWFILHTAMAIGSWLALMAAGYALNPPAAPQWLILVMSVLVPFAVGHVVNRFRQDDIATSIWLIGLIWLLIIALWILDMPTGPNQCFQCDATEKLTRTFFSYPKPSGLIDNDGPFMGTWPSAALLGYSIGARLALKRKDPDD
jgi:hypothetical protein